MPLSIILKKCSKCLEHKSISLFRKSKTGVFGVRGDCKLCQSKYNLEYYKNNKEKIILFQKKHRELNKNYYINYRLINKQNHRNYINNRLKNDPKFKLNLNIRNLIKKSIKSIGLKKNTKTEIILGCSFLEFKNHLESKFESWMTWDNYGLYNGEPNYGWDIDHILPTSSAINEEEIIKLNHYSNLQPMCSYYNRYIKSNKIY